MKKFSCLLVAAISLVAFGAVATSAAPAATNAAAAGKSARDGAIRQLGPHWSGLDRIALCDDLAGADLKSARERIEAAAHSSSRPGALWLLLIELNSTDLLRPYEGALRTITETELDARTIPGAGAFKDGSEAETSEYLAGVLYETVLGSPTAAGECYERVLGKAVADQLRSAPDNIDGAARNFGSTRRAAAIRVVSLLRKRR